MKFVSEREPLLEALQRTARVALKGGPKVIPILSHVKIEAKRNGVVRLSANDTGRELTIDTAGEVDQAGAVTASARALANFVAGSAEGSQIEMDLPKADGRLTVRAGRARAAIATLPVDQFPSFAEEDFATNFALDGEAFATALRIVSHAQSFEETRYYLNGVYVHRRSPRELVCVATNGHCMGWTFIETDADLPDLPGVILPRQTIEEVISLAERVESIDVALSDKLCRLSADGTILTTKLVDGTFPDYERVIPKGVDTGFETDRSHLVQAAKRCAAIVGNKERPLKMTPAGRVLELLGRDTDLGEITDEIDAATSCKMPIGINAGYLAAALDALGGETVRVRYADPGAPMVFTDPSEPNRLQVVMAMRV
jgi:DNA polymerase III subunit beta